MPRLRQMPELFLRGALAHQTMKNLTKQQVEEIDRLTTQIAEHPCLASNRAMFIKQLGRTIGGDYREDRKAADQEYHVAIWRGVVHLLYHRSYSYICGNCNQGTYLTQRNKPSPMNQQYPMCPACGHVRIVDPGESALRVDSFMEHRQFQELILQLPLGSLSPQCGTPIIPVPGPKKVQEPQATLEDDAQLQKFFSEFVWNYFRQILKENEITYHRKEPQSQFGPADYMAVLEIISLLGRMKIPHSYSAASQPEKGHYHVYCQTNSVPPEFSVEYSDLARRYAALGVAIKHSESEFIVASSAVAPLVEALVVRPAPVLMVPPQLRIGAGAPEPGSCAVEQLRYTNTGERPMSAIENQEILEAIRHSLPEGECRATFDILRNHGPIWSEFSDQYGDREPRSGHIASFLGTTPRAVAGHKESIRILCLSHQLVPGDLSHEED